MVGTNTYSTTGTYTDTLNSSLGCDSIVVTNLTVNPVHTINQDFTICAGEEIMVGNNTYLATGNYIDTLPSSLGCDSIVLTSLTVNPVVTTNSDYTICNGESITVGNSTYTSTGTYSDTLLSSLGCDSIVVTNLTVNESYNTYNYIALCAGGSVTVGGNVYSQTGLYVDSLLSALGCDSIITTDLVIDENIEVNQDAFICEGESFAVGSSVYTESGLYTDTLVSSQGCDSIITTSLSVAIPSILQQQAIICEGDSIVVGESVYTETGNYSDTLESGMGCDSIIIVTGLQVVPTVQVSAAYSICEGDYIVVGGSVYNQTGTYMDTLTTTLGCDSIITTSLVVNNITIISNPQTICEGETVMVGNMTYGSTGVYVDTLSSALGCDSIVITDLQVQTTPVTNNVFNLCTGGSVTVGANTYSTTGVYTDTLISGSGCDSIVVTDLTITAQLITNQTLSICTGQSIMVGGNTYNVTGNYADTLTSNLGCDSIVVTDLTVVDEFVTQITHTICEGETVMVGNSAYTLPGDYVDTLTSGFGCDSIVLSTIVVHDIAMVNNDVSICQGAFIIVGSHLYNTTGTYLDTLQSMMGCDSIVTTNLTVNQQSIVNNTLTICEGDMVTVGNNSYTTSGTFADTLSATTGCDSIIITHLTVNPIEIAGGDHVISICDTVTYFDLMLHLDSNANPNGTWVDWDASGALNGHIVDPSIAGAGTFTFAYITTSSMPCPGDTAMIELNIDSCGVLVSSGFDFVHTAWGVFPNPSNGAFYLTQTGSVIPGTWAQVTDVTGREVWIKNITSDVTTINFDGMANQIYFLKVYSAKSALIEEFKLILTE